MLIPNLGAEETAPERDVAGPSHDAVVVAARLWSWLFSDAQEIPPGRAETLGVSTGAASFQWLEDFVFFVAWSRRSPDFRN